MMKRLQAKVILFAGLSLIPVWVAAEVVKPVSNVPVVDPGASLFKVLFGLLLVILAIFASAWFFKRFNKLSPAYNENIRMLGSMSVGSREKIALIQVGEEQILVGITATQITPLHKLEENLTSPADSFTKEKKSGGLSDTSPFSSTLNSVIRQLRVK